MAVDIGAARTFPSPLAEVAVLQYHVHREPREAQLTG